MTQAQVLLEGRRRCCVCFGLNRDAQLKKGQIAHLDGNRDNNAPKNLVFLCLEHHDEYDSRTSQSKGLTLAEVTHFRKELEAHLKSHPNLAEPKTTPIPDKPSMAQLLRRFEDTEGFVNRFGKSKPPYSDDISSHIRWRLRFSRVFAIPPKRGLFFGNGDYSFGVGNDHATYKRAVNDIELFPLPESLLAPAEWIAAKDLFRLFGEPKGSISIYEYDRSDIGNVKGPEFLEAHKSRPVHGHFDVNSNRLLSADDRGEVIIWDFSTRKVLYRFRSFLTSIVNSSFCHLDGRIIVNDRDGAFEIFDPLTGRSLDHSKLKIRGDDAHVSFSVDANHLIGSDGADRWDVVDAETLEPLEKWRWGGVWVSNCVSQDERVNVLKSASGVAWVLERSADTGEMTNLDVLPPSDKRISWMAVSEDGSAVATVIEKRELRIWERV
jgi:hypothetical protein